MKADGGGSKRPKGHSKLSFRCRHWQTPRSRYLLGRGSKLAPAKYLEPFAEFASIARNCCSLYSSGENLSSLGENAKEIPIKLYYVESKSVNKHRNGYIAAI